jgi:8-oxo-dGTP diphosphatase
MTNDLFADDGLHYVTLWFEAEASSGEAIPCDETSEAAWFSDEELPEPLFLPMRNLLEGHLVQP